MLEKKVIPIQELINNEVLNDILELDDGDYGLLLELVGEFKGDFQTSSENLTQFVKTSDFDGVTSAAHKLKGTGANLGMKHFSKVAYEIEQKGKNKDLENADERIRYLIDSFDQTIDFYTNLFHEQGLEF
jgi:osomolarity two-component system, phosphorelay intermediate protein YPD1